MGSPAAASDASDAAHELARAAAKAEKKGDIARAYALYSHAYALDPSNLVCGQRMRQLEFMTKVDPALQGKADAIAKEPKPDAGLDESLLGELTAQDAAEALKPLPPAELRAVPGVQDFDIRGNGKVLFEQVAKAFGLLVMFDSEYAPSASTRFEMQQVDYRDALRTLEIATDTFVIPVSDRLIFVAADTTAKRQQFERTATLAIPIPETVSPQELQEAVNAVKTTMDIQRVLADTSNGIVVLRDRVSKVRPAEALLESLMRPHPEVDFEIELVDVDDSSSLNWGLPMPSSFPLVDFGNIARWIAPTAVPTGYTGFLTFGGGATFIGIGIAQAGQIANLLANVTNSRTTTVFRAHVAASQGLPATLHVGSKYPLVTSSFSNGIAGPTTPGTVLPAPQVQYEDLGFELKITPHVQGADEVTLDVEADYTLLGQETSIGVPAINESKFQSTVRVRNGEWAVLTGLMSKSDEASFDGIAGLGNIPILGRMLGSNSHDIDRTSTLLVIKPRLLNLPPTETAPLPTLVTGTETKPISLL
jgi:hypothetical protein